MFLKNAHQKDECFNEVGLCAQNIDTVLRSLVKPMCSFHENEKILDLIQRSKLVVELEVPTIEATYLTWRNFHKVD